MVKMRSLLTSSLLFLSVAHALPQASDSALQGFTKERLASLNAAMRKIVDDKKSASIVTLLARNGNIVNQDAYGVLDAAANTKVPVQKDSIFRIMSMTKPVVGVAMMKFFEEGKWKMEDLVTDHIPQFKSLVVKNADGTTTPPKTPMTMAQLVSHSAGFPGQLTVASDTLDDIIPPLVKGNLEFQPGKDWKYGPGVEIQGYLIQRWASGVSPSADKANITKDLSDYLQELVFKPLGMSDTGFFIDPSKASRVPKVHARTADTITPTIDRVATSKPRRLSPSGGLLSTSEDYFKFCQMLLNGGELNGKRILKQSSVKLMHTNVLEPGVKVKLSATSKGEGVGFGVDFAIIRDQKASNGSVPEESFYWGGAYGTWFWIDPVNKMVFVGMVQNQSGGQLAGDSLLRQTAANEVYPALKS